MKENERETIKTSITLPMHLWRLARMEAVNRDCDLQDIVREALRQYLGHKPKKGGA